MKKGSVLQKLNDGICRNLDLQVLLAADQDGIDSVNLVPDELVEPVVEIAEAGDVVEVVAEDHCVGVFNNILSYSCSRLLKWLGTVPGQQYPRTAP